MPEPTEAADRKARHLAMCHELAVLGMAMARTTARKAAEAAAAEDAAAENTAAAADAAAEAPTAATPDRPPVRTPDHALAFARLSRAVRQSITLEAQLAAGAIPGVRAPAAGAPGSAPGRTPARPQTRPPDPRRAPARQLLLSALANHPDAAGLKLGIAAELEDALAADPDQTVPLATIIDTICDDHGLTLDFDHLPDDLLDALSEHALLDSPTHHAHADPPG